MRSHLFTFAKWMLFSAFYLEGFRVEERVSFGLKWSPVEAHKALETSKKTCAVLPGSEGASTAGEEETLRCLQAAQETPEMQLSRVITCAGMGDTSA